MFSRIVDLLFGCLHTRYSFPLTVKGGQRSRAAFPTGTYVVCLNCGKEMPYDWKEMRIIEREKSSSVPSLATKEAA